AAVQTYAWGLRPDAHSLVAHLHALNVAAAAVSPHVPHAELWIGTHAAAPSTVIAPPPASPEPLSLFLQRHHHAPPPFLLKVLSVAAPLSIQAHPTRELAAKLHAARPDVYKDPNHKPEMSVALTPFSALCNFRPVDEILAHLHAHAPLAALCDAPSFVAALATPPAPSSTHRRAALRHLFSTLMNAAAPAVSAALAALTDSLRPASAVHSDADHLFLQLRARYPHDVGCFAAYLLNYVHLQPGHALFMAANEPHAYLHGQCVEIMACSDNVVRAGLTPKFKDVPTLVHMLSYHDAYPNVMQGTVLSRFATLYRPPVPEFQLVRYQLPPAERVVLPAVRGPSVVLCLLGTAWIRPACDADANQHQPESPPESPPKSPPSLHALAAGSIYYVPDSHRLRVDAVASPLTPAPAPSLSPSPSVILFHASTNQAQPERARDTSDAASLD
ncbi:unnamed protein product, partial [Agarophyton chilense]